MAVQSEPASKVAFCPQCGRLMADEPGPLCDVCDPVAQPAAALPPQPMVTWSLIAVTAVASLLGLMLTKEQFSAGAMFGPNFAGGEWWRLVSAVFCHNSFGHFFWNMLPLAFLGSRLERILVHWTFLAFYLGCGLIGSLTSVFLTPEVPGVGASGAVFGVCAGLFVHYARHFSQLTRRQRNKLAALGIYTGYGIWSGLFNARTDNGSHLGGLAAGVVLGWILSLRFDRPVLVRRWIFLGVGLAVVIASWSFRQSHFYLVHLDAASRALKSGQTDVAAQEIGTGLAMKPDSAIGHFLESKLKQDQADHAAH